MPTKLTIVALSVALWAIATCRSNPCPPPTQPPARVELGRFLSYDPEHPPPDGWSGPTFELSQDYPRAITESDSFDWRKFDFKAQPKEYLTEVLRYVYEGNLCVNWVVQNNPVRKWYHAPWMHGPEIKQNEDGTKCKDKKGREFVHGLTRERRASLSELNYPGSKLECDTNIQNWGMSLYNPPGGLVIRQVWEEMLVHRQPQDRFPVPENLPQQFPLGTVSVKLLFTTATPAQVPYLDGSPEWLADINRDQQPLPVRLIQLDIAVRDPRAAVKGAGWVFGTFVYDHLATPLFDDGDVATLPWRRLKPIGLTYGNDPDQTILADPDIGDTQHLGCGRRLVGPIDNPGSSCIACHLSAEVMGGNRPFERVSYKPRDIYRQCEYEDDLPYWFKTIPVGTAFSDGAISLDHSLQLQNGIVRFCQFNPQACPPIKGQIEFDPNNLGAIAECPIKPSRSCGEQVTTPGPRPAPTPATLPTKSHSAEPPRGVAR